MKASLLLTLFCILSCASTAPKLNLEREPTAAIQAAPLEQNTQSKTHEEHLKWFSDAKFGLFIHWGPYSLASVEASWAIMTPSEDPKKKISVAEYMALPQHFNPIKFDPKAWIRLAKAAGQKYIIFTTKHHDGFDMFDASNNSHYKITQTPYQKDVFAELAKAAKEEGMPLGIYYSPPDLYHPGYRDTSRPPSENYQGEPDRPEWPSYLDYMEEQLTQLLTDYGEISVVWFDYFRINKKNQGERFVNLVHKLQPSALINDRLGLPGDFDTAEQKIPKNRTSNSRAWETCMTINGSWSYNKYDQNFKSAEELIRDLIDITSSGGNFLLDVGLDALGNIQPEFQERLQSIGSWLKRNGEAVYGTRPGPRLEDSNLRATTKDTRIYVHLLKVPDTGQLSLRGRLPVLKSAWILSTGEVLQMRQTLSEVFIILPAKLSKEIFPVIALESQRVH